MLAKIVPGKMGVRLKKFSLEFEYRHRIPQTQIKYAYSEYKTGDIGVENPEGYGMNIPVNAEKETRCGNGHGGGKKGGDDCDLFDIRRFGIWECLHFRFLTFTVKIKRRHSDSKNPNGTFASPERYTVYVNALTIARFLQKSNTELS